MKWIDRFNKWYDHELQEPYRFLLFMATMAVAILPLQLGLHFENALSTSFGLVVLCILTFVAVVRAFNIGGNHKYAGVLIAMVLGFMFVLMCVGLW